MKNRNAFFSIIVPCYNVEEYVDICMDNILEQTCKNYRVIFVNDGSTDSTLEKIRQLAVKHKNITVLNSNEYEKNDKAESRINRGVVSTRNCGLEYVLSVRPNQNERFEEWIVFLDCDDLLLKDTLEKMNSIIHNNDNIDFILTDFSYIYTDSEMEEKPVLTKLTEGLLVADDVGHDFEGKISWVSISCIGTKIYKAEFLINNSLRFSDEYKYNEDGAFAIQAFMCANKIYYLRYPCYRYLQRAGSLMHSYRPGYFGYLCKVLNLYEGYLSRVAAQKNIIHKKRMEIVLESLINELRYKKYDEYEEIFKRISSDEEVADSARKLITGSNINIKYRIFSFMVLYKRKRIVRWYICGKILK